MICPITDKECKTNGCGEKCYKRDTLDSKNQVTITRCKDSYSKEDLDELAHKYAIWCWGKQIPNEVSEIEAFFKRFLKENL